MPTVETVPVGAIVRNSFFINHFYSRPGATNGYIAHIKTNEDSYGLIMHERVHIRQNKTRSTFGGQASGFFGFFPNGREIEADVLSGQLVYPESILFVYVLNNLGIVSDSTKNNWLILSSLINIRF
ncbi:hypothetical protein [Leptospira haakeii]|uniref:Uncharacterized protein n=1 Tax=Leptospira haakeii TaxID=2023198 RepID=A0ABX4PG60_9LEPT|nr:hypothetical protein [Leptospira haakeii]PKA14628.1 hypothetical protein CH363_17870 [Leptospira haakeii]PKA18740.1 hypothetical protein CH377_16405 [Leptospira haakeii]